MIDVALEEAGELRVLHTAQTLYHDCLERMIHIIPTITVEI